MTDEEFKRELLQRLDKIVALMQGVSDDDEDGACRHTDVEDYSVMGEAPGTRVLCNDCKQIIEPKGA